MYKFTQVVHKFTQVILSPMVWRVILLLWKMLACGDGLLLRGTPGGHFWKHSLLTTKHKTVNTYRNFLQFRKVFAMWSAMKSKWQNGGFARSLCTGLSSYILVTSFYNTWRTGLRMHLLGRENHLINSRRRNSANKLKVQVLLSKPGIKENAFDPLGEVFHCFHS